MTRRHSGARRAPAQTRSTLLRAPAQARSTLLRAPAQARSTALRATAPALLCAGWLLLGGACQSGGAAPPNIAAGGSGRSQDGGADASFTAGSDGSTPGAGGSGADGSGQSASSDSGDKGATSADGASGSGAADGSSSQGDDGASEGDDDVALPPVLCLPSFTWSDASEVTSVSPSQFDRFGSVSADELTVAWTSPSGEILVADRPSVSEPFGAPTQVDIGDASVAGGRVGLNPTGVEVVVALPKTADQTVLVSFVRASVGAAWEPGSSDEFKVVDAQISETGGSFSEPVIRGDGLSIFYVVTVGSNAPVLAESPWDTTTKSWANGVPLVGSQFTMTSPSQLRRATGASSDGLTLFYFDEVAGAEMAAWRQTVSSTFATFVSLPEVPEAAPSGSCQTLYFQGVDPEAGGPALFIGQ